MLFVSIVLIRLHNVAGFVLLKQINGTELAIDAIWSIGWFDAMRAPMLIAIWGLSIWPLLEVNAIAIDRAWFGVIELNWLGCTNEIWAIFCYF